MLYAYINLKVGTDMIEFRDVTGKQFNSEDAVYYRNVIQSAFMLSKPDCVLLDIFTDSNEKIVFVFPRELHKKYINEWNDRPHKKKNQP